MGPSASQQATRALERQHELKTLRWASGPDKMFTLPQGEFERATHKIMEAEIELPWEYAANVMWRLWGLLTWPGEAQTLVRRMDPTGRPGEWTGIAPPPRACKTSHAIG